MGDRPHLMLQWHDPVTGQRKSRSARTCNPLEAEKARADLEYELNHGLYLEPSRMTWERFRELFEAEYLAGRRAGTREKYRQVFDRFERLASPQTLRGVNERTLSAFAAAMRKEKQLGRGGYAPNSVRNTLDLLRTALRWAALPAVKMPKKVPQPVPTESVERLFAKAPDDNMRVFLLAGWLAGLRLGEAVALEWEGTAEAPWIDFGRRRVIFPAEFVKADADQWVPIDRELQAALEALPRRGRRVFSFTDRSGRPITAASVSLRVVELARRAGVKLSMHALRRGFGCRHAARVPAQVLQKLMRHANIKTTMTYYANVDAAVEQAIFGEEPKRADPGAQRNTSRNTAADTARVHPAGPGPNPFDDPDIGA
jgi:integrase